MFDLSKIESEKSYTPIKPGVKIPVKLENVTVSEEGHLDFHFKGTDPDNAGDFKPRFWANSFDPRDEKYNEKRTEEFLRQINQIIEAYLPKEKIALVKGESWMQFVGSIMQQLTPDTYKNVETYLNIIYQYNSDSKTTIPRYGVFISTSKNPKGLELGKGLDNRNVPYDRILPLSVYGVSGTTGSPKARESYEEIGDELPFGLGEDEIDIPAFGDN